MGGDWLIREFASLHALIRLQSERGCCPGARSWMPNRHGVSSSLLLALAAFYMGGVGMWSMHYLADM